MAPSKKFEKIQIFIKIEDRCIFQSPENRWSQTYNFTSQIAAQVKDTFPKF